MNSEPHYCAILSDSSSLGRYWWRWYIFHNLAPAIVVVSRDHISSRSFVTQIGQIILRVSVDVLPGTDKS